MSECCAQTQRNSTAGPQLWYGRTDRRWAQSRRSCGWRLGSETGGGPGSQLSFQAAFLHLSTPISLPRWSVRHPLQCFPTAGVPQRSDQTPACSLSGHPAWPSSEDSALCCLGLWLGARSFPLVSPSGDTGSLQWLGLGLLRALVPAQESTRPTPSGLSCALHTMACKPLMVRA